MESLWVEYSIVLAPSKYRKLLSLNLNSSQWILVNITVKPSDFVMAVLKLDHSLALSSWPLIIQLLLSNAAIIT